MPVIGYKSSFHNQLSKSGNPVKSTTRKAVAKMKLDQGLHAYMMKNTVCYEDDVRLSGPGDRKAKAYPQSALDVWTVIASNISNRFNVDRVGKSKPKFKAKPGATNPVGTGMPITGFQPDQTPVLIEPNGWEKKTFNLILDWFKANYDTACADGDKNRGISTVPQAKAKKLAVKITKQFGDYYKKAQFGCGGVPLPAIVLDKMKNPPFPEFMPFCKPHKNAPGNVEIQEGGKTIRKGAPGYVIGEFNTNKQFVETDTKVEIDDNGNKEEVGVVKEDAANLDKNEFLIDDDFYQPAVKLALGGSYNRFRTNVKNLTGEEGPSGLPIDGKQITIPPENEGDPATPVLIGNPPKPIYNLDRNGNGLSKRATAGGLPNPQYNKPIIDPAYGAAEMDEDLKVREWKNNSEKPMVFGPSRDKGGIWSGGSNNMGIVFGDGAEEVRCYMKFIKEDIGTGTNARTATDPRSWGPWNEYTGNGVSSELADDPVMRKSGLHKLKYKFIIPQGLVAAINTPDTPALHKAVNGLPGYKGTTLPAMNKQYWGLRVMEAFPNATSLSDAIKKATAPPKLDKNGTPLVVPGMGGILDKGGTTFVGGPAPPFIVVEKGTGLPAKVTDRWQYKNETILFKKGKLSRSSGTPFKRNSKPTKSEYRHYSKNNQNINTKIDDKIKGQASGGMTWFDASKQIIPPYAPPPLKPPLPNTKKFPF
jgi:hypothetical protein